MTGTEKLRLQALGVATGSLLVTVGGALPWAGSGRRDRSSYELVQFADRNDLLPGAVAGAARVWLLAPLALGVVLAALAFGRGRVALGVGVVLAAAVVLLAVAVLQSPLEPRYGIAVSLLGAVLVAAAAIRQAGRGAGATASPRRDG
jgi:hypothetical protein